MAVDKLLVRGNMKSAIRSPNLEIWPCGRFLVIKRPEPYTEVYKKLNEKLYKKLYKKLNKKLIRSFIRSFIKKL